MREALGFSSEHPLFGYFELNPSNASELQAVLGLPHRLNLIGTITLSIQRAKECPTLVMSNSEYMRRASGKGRRS